MKDDIVAQRDRGVKSVYSFRIDEYRKNHLRRLAKALNGDITKALYYLIDNDIDKWNKKLERSKKDK